MNAMYGLKGVETDFGSKKINIDVPADSTVIEFKDPQFLPDPAARIKQALKDPVGSAPLKELARRGMTVAIGFDDPTRPPLPWQTIIPMVIDELTGCGVRDKDICLICANGAHRKWRREELRNFLGAPLFDRFWPSGQVINHDCQDRNELSYLGRTDRGTYVEHNRRFVEADLSIYVGTVSATYVGGYSGTGAVTGLASAESLASHHAHRFWHSPKSTTGDHRTMMYRGVKAQVHDFMEQAMGKRVFYVNSIVGVGGKIAGVYAGYSPQLEAPCWDLADSFSRYPSPQADIMVIGMSDWFAYGEADNTLIAAIGCLNPPRIWLNRPVLREGGVVIGLNPSTGQIDPTMYPSYQEVIDLYDRHHDISELQQYELEISSKPKYLDLYRNGNSYHPRHPFWLMYIGHYTLQRASAVIMSGTENPGAFRKLGITPAKDFDHAWKIATSICGDKPVTVIAPTFWTRRQFKFDVSD
ncbi:MAG: lactate racemase domain-containing protein [Acidiferrobacterales bacterium]|nr:lactate racemase domain-containing protein [Acidiferrobacterales bacterium]